MRRIAASWPAIPLVPISGRKDAGSNPDDWHVVAVLQISPPQAEVWIGFNNGDNIQRTGESHTFTGGRYGMRVGNGDVKFFAIPVDPSQKVGLELVGLVQDDDPRYANLPLL